MKKTFDTVIIGAGLSGLLCGTLLSKKGQRVCLLEKNNNIGGAIQTFTRKGVTFDTGMHFFGSVGKGQIQREIFKIIGIDEKVDLIEKKGTAFNVIINDKEYEIPTGFDNFQKKLVEYFPKEKHSVELYLKRIKSIYNNLTIENLYKGIVNKTDLETGAFEFIKSITDNIDLQNLLVFNNSLYAGDKETTSLYMHAVITGSYISSTAEFKEGTKSFTDVLKNEIIQRSGVVLTTKEVVRLETVKDIITSCICSDGSEYTAENFISSLHPSLTLSLTDSNCLKSIYRKRILGLNNSAGSFLVYIIMKDSAFKYNSSIFFINNSDKVWSSENKGKGSFTMYTPYSGKSGEYAGFVEIVRSMDYEEVKNLKNTRSKLRSEEYKQFKKDKAEDIFEIISKIYPNFKDKIEEYYTSTPLTYNDYTGIPEGSMYGIVKSYKTFFESSISVRTKIKNLFLTGQSINFHGMLGVSITSLLTCSLLTGAEIYD